LARATPAAYISGEIENFSLENFSDNFFVLRYWQHGHFIDVPVDDQLPTKNGKLLFARSSNPKEFWVALAEKAYAK